MNAAVRTASETIGQHILRCRKVLGMSRSELVERCGVDRGSISRIERGAEKGIPGVRTLLPIFAALYGRRRVVADAAEIGRRVRLLREVYFLTCVEFAALIGVHKQLVSNWQRGAALPSLAAIRRMCDAFGVPLGFFSFPMALVN
jgi:transcriptional regulator with XRE-family HTH domain